MTCTHDSRICNRYASLSNGLYACDLCIERIQSVTRLDQESDKEAKLQSGEFGDISHCCGRTIYHTSSFAVSTRMHWANNEAAD